jgi:hypothetical protein
MVRRNIERFEVVVVVFDLGTFNDVETRARENVFNGKVTSIVSAASCFSAASASSASLRSVSARLTVSLA